MKDASVFQLVGTHFIRIALTNGLNRGCLKRRNQLVQIAERSLRKMRMAEGQRDIRRGGCYLTVNY
jgi:hypothetical protein